MEKQVQQVGIPVYVEGEGELDDITLNELLDELKEQDCEEEERPNRCRSFFKNVYRSWTRPKGGRQMVVRFQKLAGIIDNRVAAALILPDGRRIEFKELPSWWNVIRFKLAGLTYETYGLTH